MREAYDVIVIGGGASGMLAAVLLAGHGKKVVLVEKNKQLGKKLAATGNGRCNFTNHSMGIEHYHCGSTAFIASVLDSFSHEKCIKLFRALGILSREKDGYVYPYTNQASTIVDRLVELCNKYHVTILLEEQVVSISKSACYEVRTDQIVLIGENVLLATGGKANAPLGGSESGYQLSRSLGHHISRLTPGLTGFLSKDKILKELNGIRIQGNLSLYLDGHWVKSELGEIQMTKNGISGIPAFQLCHEAGKALSERKRVFIMIDFVPILSEKECFEFLMNHPLSGLVNKKCLMPILKRSKSDNPKDIAHTVKNFRVDIEETAGFEKAQITVGGIDVNEVEPKTMESKLLPGLYLLGELLDVDGNCGGYNLHFAWASAVFAAKNIAK